MAIEQIVEALPFVGLGLVAAYSVFSAIEYQGVSNGLREARQKYSNSGEHFRSVVRKMRDEFEHLSIVYQIIHAGEYKALIEASRP